jgi:hypothetical protein
MCSQELDFAHPSLQATGNLREQSMKFPVHGKKPGLQPGGTGRAASRQAAGLRR